MKVLFGHELFKGLMTDPWDGLAEVLVEGSAGNTVGSGWRESWW